MGIFKKKNGKPTLFGKIGKGIFNVAASFNVPGASLVAGLLPEAPKEQVVQAQQAIASVVAAPPVSAVDAKALAAQIKADLIGQGFQPAQASNIGAVAFTAAQLEPGDASKALSTAQEQVAVSQAITNNFSGNDLKKVLNGALSGAQEGAAGAYLDETEMGRAQYKAAVNAKGKQIMPYVVGTLLGIIGLMAFTRSR